MVMERLMNWSGKLIGAVLGFILTRARWACGSDDLATSTTVRGALRRRQPTRAISRRRATFCRAASGHGPCREVRGEGLGQDIPRHEASSGGSPNDADTPAAKRSIPKARRPFDPDGTLAELARVAAAREVCDVLDQMRAALWARPREGTRRRSPRRGEARYRRTRVRAPRDAAPLRAYAGAAVRTDGGGRPAHRGGAMRFSRRRDSGRGEDRDRRRGQTRLPQAHE